MAEMVNPVTKNAMANDFTDGQVFMGFFNYSVFTAVTFTLMTATYMPTRQVLTAVRCPKFYVIRRVQLVHTRMERLNFSLRLLVSCVSVYMVRGEAAAVSYAMYILAFTIGLTSLELGYQITGVRDMDLKCYHKKAGSSLVAAAIVLVAQAFFEGPVFVGPYYAIALHATTGDWLCVAMLAASFLLVPLYELTCWSRPRVYGAEVLSRRELLMTVPGNALLLAFGSWAWTTAPVLPPDR